MSNIPKDFINDLRRQMEALKPKAKPCACLKSGDLAEDGSIYLGFFNDKDWFVTADNAKNDKGKNLTMDFNGAAQYAKDLKAHGHDDWQIPSGKSTPHEPNILGEMYNNKNTGGFANSYTEKGTLLSNAHFYWSSTSSNEDNSRACYHSFKNGREGWGSKSVNKLSVRCVRSVSR